MIYIFKEDSIGHIIEQDLEEIKKNKKILLDEIKNNEIKDNKEMDFILQTIVRQNAVIDELESILNRYLEKNKIG